VDNIEAPQYRMETGDYLDILWRRRFPFYITFFIILVASLIVAYVLPPVYRSEATILIERQEIPNDLVATTVTGYVQERIVGIKQSLVTYDNLVEIANKLDLFPEMRKDGDISNMVLNIRESIFVDMVNVKASDSRKAGQATATVSFTVAYEADSPEVAQKVAAELANRYLEENKQARSRQAAEVSDFLGEEADVLRKEIESLEKKLATFKQEQREQLPELMNVNLKLYEKTEEKIEASKERILKLEDIIAALQSELSLTNPRKALITDGGKIIQSPSDRLSALTAEFIKTSTRYTPTHPDVIQLRREIQTLGGESESAAEANQLVSQLTILKTKQLKAKQNYSETHPDVVAMKKSISIVETKLRNIVIKDSKESTFTNIPPNNPRYVALKTRLDSTYLNLKEEKAKLRKFNKKSLQYEKRLYQTPVVERDYQALSRDYDNKKAKYSELKDKQLQARLAERLEIGEKAERFVLTGSAYLPTSPDKPNRLGIILLGGLLAFSGGLGSVSISEYKDKTVRGRRGVVELFGALPIVVIPYIENENSVDVSKKLKRRLLKIGIFIGIILIVLISIHTYVRPLNELWVQERDTVSVEALTKDES